MTVECDALWICTVTVVVLATIGLLLVACPTSVWREALVTIAVMLPSIVLGLVIAVRWPRNRGGAAAVSPRGGNPAGR